MEEPLPKGGIPQEVYIAMQVCPTPGDTHGYDPSLGLCLCWGQQSSRMCGPLCPEVQRHILQLSCTEGIPWISVAEGTGSQVWGLEAQAYIESKCD